jgi:hypothetical protein
MVATITAKIQSTSNEIPKIATQEPQPAIITPINPIRIKAIARGD